MSGHTPTPWRVGANGFGTQFIYGNPDQPRTSPMGVKYNDLIAGGDHPGALTEANAAFIVKAVNSHADLEKALEELLRFCDDATRHEKENPDKYSPYIEARQALAKASQP